MTLRPLKSKILAYTSNDFTRINVFDPKVILRASEGSPGPLLGTLGDLLEASRAPHECSLGPLGILLEPLGTVLGAHNHSAGPMQRDFRASWEHLAALLAPSLTLILFQDVFVFLFEPLGVDFELAR